MRRAAITLFAAAGCAAMGGAQAPLPQHVAVEMAQALVEHHVYDSAAPLLRQAIVNDPKNPDLRRALGTILTERGLFDQAQQELHYAVQLAPKDAAAASALGVLYSQQDMPEAAEVWHRRAVALGPNRAEYFNNLGFCLYLQGGRDEAALDAFGEALRRDPAAGRAHNNRGFVLARLGRWDQALKSFRQGGGKAQALTNLGLAYEIGGDFEGARAAYQDALALDRDQPTARKNLAELVGRSASPVSDTTAGQAPAEG